MPHLVRLQGSVVPIRYRGVRYRDDVGFEMRCDDCARRKDGNPCYWPLTLEFWSSRGLSRCRACWHVYDRHKTNARRAADPEYARQRDRERYRRDRVAILAKRRAFYRAKRAAADVA